MTPSYLKKDLAYFNLVMARRLHNRVMEKCEATGITRAEFTRRALADAVGDPSLAEMPRAIGRQKRRNGKRGHNA